MSTIAVNPPKTPVTEGSSGKALATMPNVCKMPGPPAPFVPTPLPNVGSSSDNLADGTTTVLFEGKKVALKGSSFKSMGSGDVASQGTGGGIVSSQTQGKTEWVAPGSIDVKAEGKNIQLLGDATTNNGGSPTNSATIKEIQGPAMAQELMQQVVCECDKEVTPGPYDTCASLGTKKHDCCEQKLMTKKGVGGERGYKADGSMISSGSRQRMVGESFGRHMSRIRGTTWPDACLLDGGGNPTKVYDFKFACPQGVPSKMKRDGTILAVAGPPQPGDMMTDAQRKKLKELTRLLGHDPDKPEHAPQEVSNKNCP